MQHRLFVSHRSVSQEGGLRLFQRRSLKAIADPNVRLVVIEAPVGAGKSYIIRQLAEQVPDRPVILTFPTKILLDAQCAALEEQEQAAGNPVAVWPEDMDRWPLDGRDALNVWKYSSDSLFTFLAERPSEFAAFRDRGQLLGDGLFSLRYGGRQLFVTTPDVLWLMYSPFSGYKPSAKQMLQAQLAQSVVCLDEFHCYANLANFYGLLEELVLKGKAGKVVMLSATPFLRLPQWGEFEHALREAGIQSQTVRFEEGSTGHVFNYPLDLTVHRFAYRRRDALIEKLREVLPGLPKPAAVIFNSLFRLAHMKSAVEGLGRDGGFLVREYSGRQKDGDVHGRIGAGEQVVLLGTSAIEVGVDMKFRGAVIEAGAWPNAIQRLGRVGRAPFCDDPSPEANVATAHLFIDSRDTWNELVTHQQLGRTELEGILMDNLRDPTEPLTTGEMFRGDSYSFVLHDRVVGRPIIYSEALFSMYDVDERDTRNLKGTREEKADVLRQAGIVGESDIRHILLRDELYPIWGVIPSSGLRDDYDPVLRVDPPERGLQRIEVQMESGRTYPFVREHHNEPMLTEMPF